MEQEHWAGIDDTHPGAICRGERTLNFTDPLIGIAWPDVGAPL